MLPLGLALFVVSVLRSINKTLGYKSSDMIEIYNLLKKIEENLKILKEYEKLFCK